MEQTTWLRRNLAVKEQEEELTPDPSLNGTSSDIVVGNSHSVQAQLVCEKQELSGVISLNIVGFVRNFGSYFRHMFWFV